MIGKKYAVEIWCLGIHWLDRWKNCCVGVSCVRVLKCSAISVSKSPPLAKTNLAWSTRTPPPKCYMRVTVGMRALSTDPGRACRFVHSGTVTCIYVSITCCSVGTASSWTALHHRGTSTPRTPRTSRRSCCTRASTCSCSCLCCC